MRVDPVTPTLGAEISGVDLRDLGEEAFASVVSALHEHGVLFFRDQKLDPVAQKALALRFGPLRYFHLPPNAHSLGGDEAEVHEIAYDPQGVMPRADEWHADITFLDPPPKITVLRSIDVPALGGDTCWASMTAAYETLSEPIKRMIEDMTATHSMGSRSRMVEQAPEPAHHPVVLRHPVTGHKVLYVNRIWTERLDGLSTRENEAVLPLLMDHVRAPELQMRFRWTPETIAIWDNRAVQHNAVPDFSARRVMHRVLVDDDRSTEI